MRAVQCNFLTDILDLVYLRFALNVQRVYLCTEEPEASRMLEPFGEVGGDVPEYFSSRTHFAKIEDKKVIENKKIITCYNTCYKGRFVEVYEC